MTLPEPTVESLLGLAPLEVGQRVRVVTRLECPYLKEIAFPEFVERWENDQTNYPLVGVYDPYGEFHIHVTRKANGMTGEVIKVESFGSHPYVVKCAFPDDQSKFFAAWFARSELERLDG